MSGLIRSWIGWHDIFVAGASRAKMAQAGEFCHICAGARALMSRFRVWARSAGVPNGDIVPTGETIVVIVEVFLVV